MLFGMLCCIRNGISILVSKVIMIDMQKGMWIDIVVNILY